MVVEEEVQETRTVRMVRCDRCVKQIRDTYDRRHMEVVTFSYVKASEDGSRSVAQRGKYHLCEQCSFELQYAFDENRKHWREKAGVTSEEQAALLQDLYPMPKRHGRALRRRKV